jgi:hypothetical protein
MAPRTPPISAWTLLLAACASQTIPAPVTDPDAASIDAALARRDTSPGSAPDRPAMPPTDSTSAEAPVTGADTAVSPDAPAGQGAALESIEVPASGASVSFRTSFERDALYLLKAVGAVNLAGQRLDAEYAGSDPANAADLVAGVDVGIDTGLLQINPANGRTAVPPGPGRAKWFGKARGDAVYFMVVTGAGQPLSLELRAPPGPTAGSGSIRVSAFRLTPLPPGIGEPLELVTVDGELKTSIQMSKLVPAEGSVYLLQCAGELQVGGPGNLGDAEFDDYRPDGTGWNEGEGGVDFGVGVDEPVIGMGHTPRKYKWGPYRKDHVYYMLYAGTGKPIVFNYHDTGGRTGRYNDNAGSLPVKIFAVP